MSGEKTNTTLARRSDDTQHKVVCNKQRCKDHRVRMEIKWPDSDRAGFLLQKYLGKYRNVTAYLCARE